ncbi:hypothetical protein IQ241_02480 [Romeria aff. gracilis LEGE 07310]|uniref:Uncharacterized protein n=1 Tax=Vasconcelosia minhoensis LEGE 07310 TaxID=915328 RepID=A0A8J7AIS3_9CYAN|nr:hypothetical protein [Romeria gracilis]MBE9076170.1 hypothetical protein [Romeria aff. gracilis LEGE 07310]
MFNGQTLGWPSLSEEAAAVLWPVVGTADRVHLQNMMGMDGFRRGRLFPV